MAGLSYRQLRVGEHLIGLTGLEEIFAELRASGQPSDPSLIPTLLAQARRYNYIPPAAEAQYGEALLEAYRRYLEEGGQPASQRTARLWRGIPREQVPWFPTVYADRCDGCGRCISFCANGVFAPQGEKVGVVEPFACEVGCNACAAICPRGAIAFPPLSILKTLKG
ncbi:MAG: 4Fe-4S dicluster domain-containing protein [Chloroflexia bacterium]